MCLIVLGSNICFDVETVAGEHADEISWTLGTCTSSQVYDDDYIIYTQQCCLAAGQHTLECKDYRGNGWNDPTSGENTYVQIDGVSYCDDFTACSPVLGTVIVTSCFTKTVTVTIGGSGVG